MMANEAFDMEDGKITRKRDRWGKSIEFLLSCIAMSVGLGNIWRFPYEAYKNGGGAFLIPYAIVLFLVAKPIYLMEMVMGQFSSKGCVKVYDFLPILRGIGTGQTLAVSLVMTYYSAIMALILYYLFLSFSPELPWTVCDPSWEGCFSTAIASNNTIGTTSSSQLYFLKTVLEQIPNIDNGIGLPRWKLVICLAIAWISIFFVVWKGVKSTGKAAYFLSIFPYVMLIILLIRALTLPGAWKGIQYFITPKFERLLDPKVWFAAVSQCFFSLSVCFGVIITYSSYNDFRHNMYRDALIVTSIDMMTSLIAGFTIFGILGYLSEQTGKDLENVVESNWNLAFISYPEAISKFGGILSNIFAVMFFVMMYVLAVGSISGMVSCSVTVITDRFPRIMRWQAVTTMCVLGFCVAIVYLTPGGMFILNLVDTHGASFIIYILGIGQIAGVVWIYGIKKFCNDIEFMLNFKVSTYWRLCWSVITPAILIVILIYSLITHQPLSYNKTSYPTTAIVFGWLLSAFGVLLLPAFAMAAIYKRRNMGFPPMITSAFKSTEEWGPMDLKIKKQWLEFASNKEVLLENDERSRLRRIFDKILGY